MTPTTNDAPVTVEQCDADRALDYLVAIEGQRITCAKGTLLASEFARHRLAALASAPAAMDARTLALVIASREFWDIHNDLSDESRALDKALEPFGEAVPYENEPASAPAGPDPDAPAYEAARLAIVGELRRIAASEPKSGYREMADRLAAGQQSTIPAYVVMQVMARRVGDYGLRLTPAVPDRAMIQAGCQVSLCPHAEVAAIYAAMLAAAPAALARPRAALGERDVVADRAKIAAIIAANFDAPTLQINLVADAILALQSPPAKVEG